MAEDAKRPIIIIKKKVNHGGHHGGAWKVAYADFVTAMMALFIVLWLMSTSQKTKDAISGYFKDPSGNGKQVGTNIKGAGRDKPAEVKKEDLNELKEKIKAAMKLIPNFEKLKANIELTITPEGLKIELLENSKGMFFESGKPEPTPVGRQVLMALAKEIGKIPNHLLVEGHTDSMPYGSDSYSNWNLSSDRANEARKIMIGNGLQSKQVAQIRGYADQELRNKTNPMDPANRRVSLIVQNQGPVQELKVPNEDGFGIKQNSPPGPDAAKAPPASAKQAGAAAIPPTEAKHKN
jgi:chemotaxis protein MotB